MIRIVLASMVFATIVLASVTLVARSTGITAQAYTFSAVASGPPTSAPDLSGTAGNAPSVFALDFISAPGFEQARAPHTATWHHYSDTVLE